MTEQDHAKQIAEIRERERGASIGPWALAQLPSQGNDVGKLGPYVYKPNWGAVAITPKDSSQYSNIGGNLTFIAHAREDIPWLLSILEAAEIENAKLRKAPIDRETHLPELIEALEKIMNCMGGKDGQSGWEAPEDVWEIAYHALALIKGGA